DARHRRLRGGHDGLLGHPPLPHRHPLRPAPDADQASAHPGASPPSCAATTGTLTVSAPTAAGTPSSPPLRRRPRAPGGLSPSCARPSAAAPPARGGTRTDTEAVNP